MVFVAGTSTIARWPSVEIQMWDGQLRLIFGSGTEATAILFVSHAGPFQAGMVMWVGKSELLITGGLWLSLMVILA